MENILKQEIHDGIVRDVIRDEEGVHIRVTIFDNKRHDRIEEVFPDDVFRDGIPEIGNSVQYHALQYKNKEYDGYFTRGVTKKRPLSDFDPKIVRRVEEYFSRRKNGFNLRLRLRETVRRIKDYFNLP